MFKMALLAIVVPALVFGCVRDVKTESAADFSLASGQTWDWVPDQVETWQDYKRGAHQARINVNDAYAEQRQQNRAEREARRDEPVGEERKEDRRKEIYDTEAEPPTTDPDAGDEARALKREHKHIQESIEGELSSKGIQRVQGVSPTYYVAYYLFTNGEAIAPREYAAYQERTEWGDDWDRFAEDALLIDIVDPATGQLLWSGSGEGNTRGGGDDSDRMRGVKEAVRHIMSDLN
jgi:hypothetical protein